MNLNELENALKKEQRQKEAMKGRMNKLIDSLALLDSEKSEKEKNAIAKKLTA